MLIGCALSFMVAAGCQQPRPERVAIEYARGDSLEVSGTLIDSRCFNLDPANVGVDHIRPEGFVKACAQACANMGFPAAVLKNGDPDDDVWVLIAVPAILADYMAETVRVRGVVRSAGILIPERVEIRDGDEWLTIM